MTRILILASCWTLVAASLAGCGLLNHHAAQATNLLQAPLRALPRL